MHLGSLTTLMNIKSEPQNIEQEISNDEVWNRFAPTILAKIKSIEFLTSTFLIPCSIFDIRFFKVSFTIRLDVRGQRQRSCETSVNDEYRMPIS
ncbi:hypothetical protein D1AOALGA4SA_7565 [Olavius algarvensis Delta 1 endosymbiont]|nr:hypothetical protein D1AOALGA4SA_7565 [Olavius algarvensis Delta 1 endosymbiont]